MRKAGIGNVSVSRAETGRQGGGGVAKIAAWALAAGLIAGCLGAPGARAGGTIQTLASFTGANGQAPKAGLTQVNGTLYGTTVAGGSSNYGTVFSYDPMHGLQSLASFPSFTGVNALNAHANGLIDVNGTLYGTTGGGGSSDDGSLFSYDATHGLQTLASFTGNNGASPQGRLIDVNGTLYGTTASGGGSGYGTLFSYSLPSSATVPEPPGSLVMLVGLTGLIGIRRKRPLVSAQTRSTGRLSALDRVRKPHPGTMPAPAGAPRSWG